MTDKDTIRNLMDCLKDAMESRLEHKICSFFGSSCINCEGSCKCHKWALALRDAAARLDDKAKDEVRVVYRIGNGDVFHNCNFAELDDCVKALDEVSKMIPFKGKANIYKVSITEKVEGIV